MIASLTGKKFVSSGLQEFVLTSTGIFFWHFLCSEIFFKSILKDFSAGPPLIQLQL